MRHLVLLLFCLFLSSILTAQKKRPYRMLTSVAYNDTLRKNDQADPDLFRKVHELIPRFDESSEWEEITVPIIFHVLYNDASNRVTEEQMAEQLISLNQDFAGLTEPATTDERDLQGTFARAKIDTKIRFCFPDQKSLDRLSYTIDRKKVTRQLPDDLSLLKTSISGLPVRDTKKYLNVWIAPLPDNNVGFAQMPLGNEKLDGIVIDPRYFGSFGTAVAPYNRGKTLTHLIGTYLGLTPIWGDGGPCGDDGIVDTPVHNGPNYGTTSPGHISTCPGNPLEMTMNFMDAGDDDQLHMFTKGQATWMRAVLSKGGPRGNLLKTQTECNIAKSLFSRTSLDNVSISQDEQLHLSTYPNPVKAAFTVEVKGGPAGTRVKQLEVYNTQGRLIHAVDKNTGELKFRINTDTWTQGVYFISVTTDGDQSLVSRITVQ
ncbi:zinc-dependent metalloprotease [Neolewinella antarctica]|nr:zinc-dependent metalloprotease [Neolewinella antarctica]